MENNEILQAIKDLPLTTLQLREIIETARKAIQLHNQVEDLASLINSKFKAQERKDRLRRLYSERNSGKTYKEVGQIFGVGAERALQLYGQAKRLNNQGKLFPQNTNV